MKRYGRKEERETFAKIDATIDIAIVAVDIFTQAWGSDDGEGMVVPWELWSDLEKAINKRRALI